MTLLQINWPVVSAHVDNLVIQGGASKVQESIANAHLGNMGALALVSGFFGGLFALYLLMCYCFKRICEKCGTEPGILVWIPIFNFIRLLQAGGSSGWLFLLLLIPYLNVFAIIIMWVKVCEAREKSAWLALLAFIPLVNVALLLFLAFSD